jgi:hypothetical protein
MCQLYAAATAILGVMKKLLLLAIRAYQIALSPFFGTQCRFHPTCSQYGQRRLKFTARGAVCGLRSSASSNANRGTQVALILCRRHADMLPFP